MAVGRRNVFSRNVFVNCPFDSEYLPLLRPLLFTIIYVGFIPRIASERADSGEKRVDKICELIRACQYSIHDLSRLRASEIGEFSRMNMPFELGIEYGSRRFGAQPSIEPLRVRVQHAPRTSPVSRHTRRASHQLSTRSARRVFQRLGAPRRSSWKYALPG